MAYGRCPRAETRADAVQLETLCADANLGLSDADTKRRGNGVNRVDACDQLGCLGMRAGGCTSKCWIDLRKFSTDSVE